MRIRLTLLLLASALLFGCAEASGQVSSITPEELLSEAPANALILDVRSEQEYGGGHVPGAINLPHDELENRLIELNDEKDRPLIVYCESGRRAGAAESILIGAGFSDVRHLEGDMRAWRAAGRPTATP